MTRQEILEGLKAGKFDVQEAASLLQAMDKPAGKMFCKVSRKGAISVYGLQQMPVTLYVEQWGRLFAFQKEFAAFVKQWDGKDYKSESALERGGEKVPYTARIAHKAA